MPYSIFRVSSNYKRVCEIANGNDVWLVYIDDLQLAGKLRDTQPTATNTQYSDQEMSALARARAAKVTQADQAALNMNTFRPLSFEDVIYRLEAQYLTALTAQPQDVTATATAWSKLCNFIKRHDGTDNVLQYRYSLEHHFVGETAHIRASKVLNPSRTLIFRCTTQQPSQKFTTFMQAGIQRDNLRNEPVNNSNAKTEINEVLVAPKTVGRAVQAHQDILASFLHGLSPARKQQLAQWVGQTFAQQHVAGAQVRRVGIWIRNVVVQQGDTHTADQNMSKQRFTKILDAVHAAGVHEIILLGDGLPNANWLNHPQQNPHYALQPGQGQGGVYDFCKLWDNNGAALPQAQHGAQPNAAQHYRGYAEQVAVYTALYRNPDANTHVNMECVITNKSGGPDLPSLAGVPQIQMAEMTPAELMVHHRMGFQALCSPCWTVLRVPQRQPQQVMDLSLQEQNELTQLVRRAQRIRTWHMQQLGNKRHNWQN